MPHSFKDKIETILIIKRNMNGNIVLKIICYGGRDDQLLFMENLVVIHSLGIWKGGRDFEWKHSNVLYIAKISLSPGPAWLS